MGGGQRYASLSRLQILGHSAISDSTVRIKQITFIIISLHDGIDNLVIIVAVGMDVTTDVLITAKNLHHTLKVVGASGIQCRSNAVLGRLGSKDTRLDVVIENIVLVLNADKAPNRQPHRLCH